MLFKSWQNSRRYINEVLTSSASQVFQFYNYFSLSRCPNLSKNKWFIKMCGCKVGPFSPWSKQNWIRKYLLWENNQPSLVYGWFKIVCGKGYATENITTLAKFITKINMKFDLENSPTKHRDKMEKTKLRLSTWHYKKQMT